MGDALGGEWWKATLLLVGNGCRWWAMQSQSLLMASSDPCHQGKDIAAAIKEMYSRNPHIFVTRRKLKEKHTRYFLHASKISLSCNLLLRQGGRYLQRGAAWQKGKKEGETNTSHLHPQPPFIISNPWRSFIFKQDDLFFNTLQFLFAIFNFILSYGTIGSIPS